MADDFFRLIDSYVQGNWETVKITKGGGDHVCSRCEKDVKKRKMKLVGEGTPQIICFGCWGKYKEWEQRELNARRLRRTFSWKIPVNRH